MKCSVYELGKLKKYKYVVTFARFQNKWIICKHKDRETWETSGGHIEKNETPIEAAKRELYEETGSIDFDIIPICDYWACDEPHETENITWSNGQVFLADVKGMEKLPNNEMECVDFFDEFPKNLTYPDITRKLLPYIMDNLKNIKHFNKLVRDKIINIIEENENIANYEILSEQKYTEELNKKLIEETNEYILENSNEELVDILEVLYAIIENKKIGIEKIEEIRKKKKLERGAFENKIFLKYVMEKRHNCT